MWEVPQNTHAISDYRIEKNSQTVARQLAAKRASYLVEEKQAICLLAAANPSWTLAALANEFNRTDNKTMKPSTVCEILKQKEKWLAVVANWHKGLGHTFACLFPWGKPLSRCNEFGL